MKLHNDQHQFLELILQTATHFGLQPFQVEKDYYVSLFLKVLNKQSSHVVFKGGTSLSKCYDVIKRFSEDIDLNVILEPNQSKVPSSTRQKLKRDIQATISSLGFKLLNPESVKSGRDFNAYKVGYLNSYESDGEMIQHIIVETNVSHRVFPLQELNVSNYITKYIESTDAPEEEKITFFNDYEMHPFTCKVQTIERTFLDKLFAICDYYESGKSERFSRHLYDVHKIWGSNLLHADHLKQLLPEVIEIRQLGRDTTSSQPGYPIHDTFQKIIQSEFYKTDYLKNTRTFLFEDVSYEQVISTLQSILQTDLLPKKIHIQ
ncbi:MAG: nucleotidyl transferase AbiEii/AbiGii toxin family protein [Exiguobacterium sp.]|nr:nucleotidyl transferase AbiEii/AbiGii toxin family protein [Exiguobacterium sp.]